MSFLLRLMPFRWYAIGGAFALTLTGWGAQTWRLHTAQANLSKAKQEQAELEGRIASAALEATQKYRAEEQRRNDAIKEIVNETVRNASAVASDAVAARDAHERLLVRVRSLLAYGRAPSGNSAVAEGSATAEGAGLVLTQLFGRIDTRAGELAAVADERGLAGQACQRAYDALKP